MRVTCGAKAKAVPSANTPAGEQPSPSCLCKPAGACGTTPPGAKPCRPSSTGTGPRTTCHDCAAADRSSSRSVPEVEFQSCASTKMHWRLASSDGSAAERDMEKESASVRVTVKRSQSLMEV